MCQLGALSQQGPPGLGFLDLCMAECIDCGARPAQTEALRGGSSQDEIQVDKQDYGLSLELAIIFSSISHWPEGVTWLT
jgi:hypothetical protein